MRAWQTLSSAHLLVPLDPAGIGAWLRSGRGFVHNTLMLEGVEKSVAWAPALGPVKPPYFPTHRTLHRLGPRMVALEGHRDWTVLPGVVWDGLRG